MKKLSSSQIRSMFLDYFRENGHMIEPGASLVPHDDPTLLWINSGVAALKKYLDGREKPARNRIANAQKCIRTNDIDNVGKTARHHTFFEMLGNWSIGDYFKEESLKFSWEFLTGEKWMAFDPEKLYVTVYPDDTETYRIWTEVIGLNPKHILKSYDNFWEIGEGPCGPDSEIYYDRGEKYDPLGLGEKLFFEEMENDRYIELWNNVFSQYNAKEGVDRKDYEELPHKNIDTGMGLERLTSIIQGGETNYDTDLFLPTIGAIEKLTDKKYEGENKMAYRVIADHIRTVTFALADGATFSNEGRGYILRRVLRRAVRYSKKLGIKDSYMYKLVPVVVENMKDFYPYLVEKTEFIQKLIKTEEEKFASTLDAGEKILQQVLQNSASKLLAGDVVFKLYDTYGFPLELTKEIAEEKGFEIDEEGFNKEMAAQKQRARDARSDDQSMGSQSVDLMEFDKPSKFIGYENNENDGIVVGLFKNGVKVDEISDEGDVVFDETCFYAESGGQIYDTGIISNDKCSLKVVKVIKAPLKQHLHHVVVEKGVVKMNEKFHLHINEDDRTLIRSNHSSLHLLQSALRDVIGTHVHQAGSFVCADYARFDFTHYEKVTNEQIKEIEKMVNNWIAKAIVIDTKVMDKQEAMKLNAMALFDEKYEDKVRVVSMGDASIEFCGGTHAFNTANLGIFKIFSEESIGSGIRRMTVKTSKGGYEETLAQQAMLEKAASDLKVNSIGMVNEKIEQLINENNALNKTIIALKNQLSLAKAAELIAEAKDENGLKVLIKQSDADDVKALVESLLSKLEDGVILLYKVGEDKVTFCAGCSKKAIEKGIKASLLVKTAAMACNGNGGGRDDVASAGGKDVSKVNEAIAKVKDIIK